MKIIYTVALCLVIALGGTSQGFNHELTKGNYVVLGAYLKGDEKYVNYFVESLKSKNLNPKAGFESVRKFYWVYLDSFPDLKSALAKMEETRRLPGLEKAWVRVVKDETQAIGATPSSTTPQKSTREEPIKTETPIPSQIITAKPEQNPSVEISKPAERKSNDSTSSTIAQKNIPEESTKIDSITTDNKKASDEPIPVSVTTEAAKEPQTSKTVGNSLDKSVIPGIEVVFDIYNPQKNLLIDGEVQVIDTDRSRPITKLKGNEKVRLTDPKNNSGRLSLVCDIFGYRKLQKEISYPTPKPEEAEMVDNLYRVKFEMVRYHRGDIRTLYSVFFYNDAAVMLPESKHELNNLLDMMKENLNYEIILHGHTNGNARGKIITMGTSQDFFTLSKDNKVIPNGSAKELSNQRAITIRDWLIANGIDASRIEVIPWGGRRMVHDKSGVHAKKNIRVEVEVVKD